MAHATPIPLADILARATYRDDSVEIVFSDVRRVVCDGPGAGLGHPRVFYTIGDQGYAECGYCDRLFVLDAARKGQRLEGHAAIDAARHPDRLPNDGLTASATPLPGEILATGGDTDA